MNAAPAPESIVDVVSNSLLKLPLAYRHRPNNAIHDDLALTDEWQDEVYEYAALVSDQIEARTVLDFGCGSAYKLRKYFGNRPPRTFGIDIPQTIAELRKRYGSTDKAEFGTECYWHAANLIICADVIEHVPDPLKLIETLKALRPMRVVFSTPDRNLLESGTLGPPANPAHVREWSFNEFNAFIGGHFQILGHFITNAEQATQLIDCKVYGH